MEWTTLSSRQNPTVKRVVSLRDKKARDQAGLFAVEGVRFLADLSDDRIFPQEIFLSEEARLSPEEVAARFAGAETKLYRVTASVYDKLSEEKAGEGVIAVYRALCLPAPRDETESCVLALIDLRDPGNVGTCLRTAAALGFDAVWLVSSADPLGSKALRASMGAALRIPFRVFSSGEELLSYAEKRGFFTVAACLTDDAVDLREVPFPRPLCLMVGNEGHGLPEAVLQGANMRAVIPMKGMESLNAAAAAAVLIWEVKRREV